MVGGHHGKREDNELIYLIDVSRYTTGENKSRNWYISDEVFLFFFNIALSLALDLF